MKISSTHKDYRAGLMKVFFRDTFIAMPVSHDLYQENGEGKWKKAHPSEILTQYSLLQKLKSPRRMEHLCPMYMACLTLAFKYRCLWSDFSCEFCPTFNKRTNLQLVEKLGSFYSEHNDYLFENLKVEKDYLFIPFFAQKERGTEEMKENGKLYENDRAEIFLGSLSENVPAVRFVSLFFQKGPSETDEVQKKRVGWYKEQAKIIECPAIWICNEIANIKGWRYGCCCLCPLPDLEKKEFRKAIKELKRIYHSTKAIKRGIEDGAISITEDNENGELIWPNEKYQKKRSLPFLKNATSGTNPIDKKTSPKKKKERWSRLPNYKMVNVSTGEEENLIKHGKKSAFDKAQNWANETGCEIKLVKVFFNGNIVEMGNFFTGNDQAQPQSTKPKRSVTEKFSEGQTKNDPTPSSKNPLLPVLSKVFSTLREIENWPIYNGNGDFENGELLECVEMSSCGDFGCIPLGFMMKEALDKRHANNQELPLPPEIRARKADLAQVGKLANSFICLRAQQNKKS